MHGGGGGGGGGGGDGDGRLHLIAQSLVFRGYAESGQRVSVSQLTSERARVCNPPRIPDMLHARCCRAVNAHQQLAPGKVFMVAENAQYWPEIVVHAPSPAARLSFCCTPPPPLAGASIGKQKGRQQKDSLADG